MYKKMLVLLDGSELAEIVLKYAQELSGRLQIDLELLHVCDPRETQQLPMHRAYIEHMAEALCARAEEISTKYTNAIDACIRAKGHVAVGNPAEEILKWVEQNDIDLVMMSTHGRSGIKEWDLGGVANKVIHASRVPVWLVPAELREEVILDTLPARTLVVPLSGSKQSEAVLPHAMAIAKQRGADSQLVLVHVYDPSVISETREALDLQEKERAKKTEYLESVVERVTAEGLPARSELLMGDPAEAIIDYLKSNPAQLLAMATRGYTRLSRMVFGSVSENVIHMVKKTPLLLVGETS